MLRALRDRLTGGGYSFKVNVVAGAATATNIAVTGIKLGDRILSVLDISPHPAVAGLADVVKGDRTAETAITSDGNIQLSTTVTTGQQLLVMWIAVGR